MAYLQDDNSWRSLIRNSIACAAVELAVLQSGGTGTKFSLATAIKLKLDSTKNEDGSQVHTTNTLDTQDVGVGGPPEDVRRQIPRNPKRNR